jgi:hypothetical protein
LAAWEPIWKWWMHLQQKGLNQIILQFMRNKLYA